MHAPGRPPATTFECIEAWALREPARLALVQGAQAWSYEALYQDIVRIARVLAARGIGRGERVAVGASGFQAGLVLLLAAETLGAVITSFQAADDVDAQALFAIVDWVVSDLPQPAPATARFIFVDADFVRELQEADPTQVSP